jgi:outer membrane cobalamin receptor
VQTSLVRSVLLSFIVFTSLVQVALAGPVIGRVVDPDGRAAPGATILLVQGTSIVASAVTDGAGQFAVQAPSNGSFELRVALDGFRSEPLKITGDTESHEVGTITLAVSAISESMLVSASQTDIPLTTTSSSVTVITGEQLEAHQVESLGDALRVVPGLSVAASGGRGAVTSVFPRGGESDYSLVFVDGVQANAFGGGYDFAHVPIANIDRIEIVRGPQSALYGSNAIGSVIRVITKRGGPPSVEGSVEGGSFGTSRLIASTAGGIDTWQWGLAAERLATDGMNGEIAPAGETVVNDDYTRHSVAGGIGWTPRAGAGLRADVNYLRDERGFPGPFGSNPAGVFEGINSVARGNDERWLASLSGAAPINSRVRVQVQAAHSSIDDEFVDTFGPSTSSSRRTSARGQIDLRASSDLEGSAGLEYQHERANSTFITDGSASEVPVERGLTGVFAEARWHHAARVFLTGGVRVDRITRDALPGGSFGLRPDFGDDTVVSANPKIAIAWFVHSTGGNFTKVRGSAGTGIRPPDAFEIAFTDNPSLKPERSKSFDAGIDQSFMAGHVLLEATAFFNRYDDLIVAVGSFQGSSRYLTDNISNARAAGLETAATLRTRRSGHVPLDLELRVGYTFLNTEILAVDSGDGAPRPFVPGDQLLRRPTHVFSVDALLQAGRLTGFVQGGGRGEMVDIEPTLGASGGMFENPGYAVWNVGASFRLVPHVEVYGRVTNIFDRAYEEVLGYPALGRGAYAGLRVAAGR